MENLPKLREFEEGDIQLGRDELIKKEGEDINEEADKGSEGVREVTQEDR